MWVSSWFERGSFIPSRELEKSHFSSRRWFFQFVLNSISCILPFQYCSCNYPLEAQMWLKRNFNWNQWTAMLCFLPFPISTVKAQFLVSWNIYHSGWFYCFLLLARMLPLQAFFSFTVLVIKKEATSLASGFPKLLVLTLQSAFPSLLLIKVYIWLALYLVFCWSFCLFVWFIYKCAIYWKCFLLSFYF